MLGILITSAFLGFICYFLFTIYTEAEKRDYSIKNRIAERQRTANNEYLKNPWNLEKAPGVLNEHDPWKKDDVNRWKRPEDQKKDTIETWTIDFLKSLEWKRFEEVCMEYLRIKNCHAFVTCTGADGGIDITVRDSNGTIFAVGQCKSWKRQIGVNLIRELYGVMAHEKAKHGIFLTTSTYSVEARAFARDKHLMLIDAEELVKLINNMDKESKERLDKLATKGDYTTPTCVQCNEKMVKRVAKNGKNKGGEFWGCINYPKCRMTMKVR